MVEIVAASVAHHRARRLFVGPIGYLFLAAAVVGLLLIGAGRKPATPDAARAAHLESIIRCPSCADLSIADSETPAARGLRQEVSQLVDAGLSDATIEARIESQFPGTLLLPSGDAGVAVFAIPAAVIVAGAITFVVLLFRRSRTVALDDDADTELVERARRARQQHR